MKPKSIKEIAIAFSSGEFEKTYPYLDSNIVWEIVGKNRFIGKEKVVTNCKLTQAYFNSAETIFITDDTQIFENNVMVRGSAEFKRNGERINFIKACDVYKFDNEGNIQNIQSYCIPDKLASSFGPT